MKKKNQKNNSKQYIIQWQTTNVIEKQKIGNKPSNNWTLNEGIPIKFMSKLVDLLACKIIQYVANLSQKNLHDGKCML